MARQGRGCAVEGCWRRAMAGKMVCRDHRHSGLGKELEREIAKLERSLRGMLIQTGQMEEKAAVRKFRREVERGEYAAVFAGRMRELFEEQDRGVFDEEIGALRVAMMRLLTEENDPTKLALALSRVTNAMVRATKAQEEVTSTRSSRRTLEGSMRAVERASREMTEEEAWAIEVREWKRQVGWNKQMEKEWHSPAFQRKLLAEGIREATERMSRSRTEEEMAVYSLTPSPSHSRERGDDALIPGDLDGMALTPGPSPNSGRGGMNALTDDPGFGCRSGEIGELVERALLALEAGASDEREVQESGEVAPIAEAEEGAGSGADEATTGDAWPTDWAERKGVPKYKNELERLFWESPDPFAYQKEVARQMEEEKKSRGKGR